jgi:dihydroflavonol-4-reductase
MIEVLVTGGTGFVAQHIIEHLLQTGKYKVRATVRDPDNASKNSVLLSLPGASERLELVKADLLDEGSFDKACEGVTHILHTASPYVMEVKDPKKDLLDPAVNGTLNLLRSAAKSPSVTRVIVTSSIAAVTDEPENGVTYDESHWNERSSLTRLPYYFSKVQAEKAAFKFMEDTKPQFALATVNPSVVWGPERGPGINTSNKMLEDVVNGTYPMVMALDWPVVDVRDLALVHEAVMLAGEGRFLACAGSITMAEVCKIIHEFFPNMPTPTRDWTSGFCTSIVKATAFTQPSAIKSYLKNHLGKEFKISNAKSLTLPGVSYRPFRDTIRDTLVDLVNKGAVDKALKKKKLTHEEALSANPIKK